MSHQHKIHFILSLCLILVLSIASAANAQSPADDTTLGDSLNLDESGTPIEGGNLGTVMSGYKDGATPEPPVDGTVEPPADGTVEPPVDGTAEPPTDGTAEPVKQHPVATALADYFGVEYDQIMSLHESGYGFGNIAKAYFFGNELGIDPQVMLSEAHTSGWGNVLKENGVHPGAVGKGNDKKSDLTEQTDEAGKPQHGGKPDFAGPGSNDNGNGNGKDKDKGGDKDHGGGNGHGNKK